MNRLHLLLLFVFFSLSACQSPTGNNDRNPPKNPVKPYKINITGAKSALISKSSVSASASNFSAMAVGETTKLFKITDDGYFLEVSYTDASGDAVVLSSSPAAYIANVGPDYTAVYFVTNFDYYGALSLALSAASDVYLVKNDTGDAVNIIEYGSPQYPPLYYKDSDIFRPANGYYFYIAEAESSNRRQVVRLEASTQELKVITPTIDHVVYFDVDDSGNVIYSGYLWSDTSAKSKRVITTDDASHDVPGAGINITFWKGPNGKLYYYDNADFHIKVINVDASNDVSFDTYMIPGYHIPLASNAYCLRTSDRVIITSTTVTDIGGDYEVMDVYNSGATPNKFKLNTIGIVSIDTAIADSSAFYFSGPDSSGDDIVVKLSEGGAAAAAMMSPLSFGIQAASFGGSTTILTSDYKVLKMVPNGAGGIIFSGIREADLQNVVGEIDSFGNDTIYQTGSQAEAEALVKLN